MLDNTAIFNIITETLGCEAEKVAPTANLNTDLGADSLALVELTMALEDATGITFEEEAMSQVHTVQDILDYLASRKA